MALFLSLNIIFSNTNQVAFGEKQEDECDDVGTNHGDNNPSEKKFFKDIKEKNVCEVARDIDRMILEGSIEEDSKCDWECFSALPVFKEKPAELTEDGFIEIKGCMVERHDDFPKDNGDSHLAAYEIRNCAFGDY